MANTSKANRNDLCPCGSRKKFKKCCGLNQQTSKGNTIMLVLVVALVIAGAAAVVSNFASDRTHASRPGGVWSPEHGHYH